jgi:hypothetical protein
MDTTPESIVLYLLNTPVAAFVGKQLRDTGIKYLKDKITAKDNYRERLVGRVRDFMHLQDERTGVDHSRPQRYFWQLEWAWHHVLAYRFYSAALPPLSLADMPVVPNLVQPSQDELNQFCEELWAYLAEDSELQKLFVSENYQQEVFEGNARNEALHEQLRSQLSALEHGQSSTADVEALLDIVEREYIRHFNPQAALLLLNKYAGHIQTRHEANSQLLARFEYLVGLAHLETGEHKLAHPHLVRAYELQSQTARYAKAAVISHARFSSQETAEAMASKILAGDSLNPAALAVNVFLEGALKLSESLDLVPSTVAETPEFRLNLLELLGTLEYPAAELIFQNHLTEFPRPSQLTFNNRSYWVLLAQIIVQFEVGTQLYDNDHHKPAGTNAPARLQAAYNLLGQYRDLIHGTEKFALGGGFWYFRGLSGYFLTGDEAEFADYRLTFPNQSAVIKQRFGLWWALLLSRWGKPAEQVLDVLDQLDASDDLNIDFLRFQQFRLLGRDSEAQESLGRDLGRIESFEAPTYTRARLYLELYCKDSISRENFIELCRSRGQLAPSLPAYLLEAAAYKPDETRREEVTELLTKAEELLSEEPAPGYVFDLAGLFSELQSFAKSNSLLPPLLDTGSPSLREQAETLYLHNLYQLNENSQELLQRLREWRNRYAPTPQFCFWEMELAELLGDWPRLMEVAELAYSAFPNDRRFYWKYIHSLYEAGLKERLREEVIQVVQEPHRLARPHLFNVAALARREGWRAEALAIVYPLALSRTDIDARNRFIGLFLFGGEEAEAAPTEASIGVSVEYTLDGTLQPALLLTDKLISEGRHPFAKRLVGLQVGSKLSITDALGKTRLIEVVSLLSPYPALFRDIVLQSEQQEGTLKIQSIKVAPGDIEQFQQTLVRNFGESEEARRFRIKELLEDVGTGKQGFSAVARGICSGNGLDAYQIITSSEGSGIRLVPSLAYDHIELTPELTYVLDWSTLPLFYQLHEQELIALPVSLWVARQIPEFLTALIAEKQQAPISKMSAVISRGGVRPIVYADTYKEDEINFLTKLLGWVTKHCQTRIVPEKLDLLRQAGREGREWLDDDENDYLAGGIDTLFLADHPNTFLVSDDMTFLPLLQRNGSAVSSEKLLRSFHPDSYNEQILPVMLKLRYTGLAIDSQALYKLFISDGGSFSKLSLRYLESLGFNVAVDMRELFRIHQFIKEVYLSGTLLPEQMDRATVVVYIQALRFIELQPQLRQRTLEFIGRIFRLLPLAEFRIRRAFEAAWQHVLLSRSE